MKRKLIFHIDVNAAFLSWTACDLVEKGANVDLRKVPSVISRHEEKGHGIVLDKSIVAENYQIHKGEALYSARKKCPNLIVASPDFSLYAQKSSELIQLLGTYTSLVQPYSMDKAWMDMTEHASVRDYPAALAFELKDDIYNKLGFTVNIGVSSNYLLSKMASNLGKIDKVQTLFPEEIKEKMWPLSVEKLLFVGESRANYLHNLGIHTIGELARIDPKILTLHLKKYGEDIWNYANGRELSDSLLKKAQTKSYGSTMTIYQYIKDIDAASQVLLSLCEIVGVRLCQDKRKASSLSVQIKDYQFHGVSRQNILTNPTNSAKVLYEEARTLFHKVWNGQALRMIGVSVPKVVEGGYEQLSLF